MRSRSTRHWNHVPLLAQRPNRGSAIPVQICCRPTTCQLEAKLIDCRNQCRSGWMKAGVQPTSLMVTVIHPEAVAESSTGIRLQKHLGSHQQETSCVFAPAPTTVESHRAYQAKPGRIARHVRSSEQIRCPNVSEDLGNHPPQVLKCSFRPYTP